MYLSKLEIQGFKSFAQRVSLNFDSGMSAIVGPNGCGKTNIVDAIRWVLGEQRYSALRSEKMEDVIFNGTKARKPLGMAEASLVIENTKGILPSEYTQVTVGRRIYRSGESEYLLNKVPCRLKDILDLFMDTGMGADAYSVIELKMIETILSDKTDERRHLFEEAAGVTKYKHRRRAAYRKLDAVRADLVTLLVLDYNYTSCGIGYLMTTATLDFHVNAYTVVGEACATGYYSFAHEQGHNEGAHHDRWTVDDDLVLYPYAYGFWMWSTTLSRYTHRTIMAYDCYAYQGVSCTRVNYWSNPAVSYSGMPTGIAAGLTNAADNHLTLNNTAPLVAKFRDGLPPNTPTGLTVADTSTTSIPD